VRTLAVTSAANQEGKTSVAVQLAVSIARALREPTLLIDGDMRSPSIHGFRGPLEPGLSDVLEGTCAIGDAIQKTSSENLWVLPAGRLHGTPHALLANGGVNALLERVLCDYRYVMIDTPPVLAASEALTLTRAADAAIICTMRDVSRIHQVKKATERVVAAGAGDWPAWFSAASRPDSTFSDMAGIPTRKVDRAARHGTQLA